MRSLQLEITEMGNLSSHEIFQCTITIKYLTERIYKKQESLIIYRKCVLQNSDALWDVY